MASVKKADIPEVAEFMTDMWVFMKSFWIPEDDDEYWQDVISKSGELGEKYHHDFCVAAICFVVDYFEWKYKKSKGDTKYSFNKWLYARYAERAKIKGAER